MKRFGEFIYMSCWILSCQIITADLGITTERNVWGKYIVAIVAGLSWAFYFQPILKKESAKKESNPQ